MSPYFRAWDLLAHWDGPFHPLAVQLVARMLLARAPGLSSIYDEYGSDEGLYD